MHGSRFSVPRAPCNLIVIKKGLIQSARELTNPRQELASLVTTKMTAKAVILESVLVQRRVPTPVETWQHTQQTTETEMSQSWDIYLFSN